MEVIASRFINPFVGVGTEVVSLSLQQVLRQSLVPVAIVVGQGGGEGRYGHAMGNSQGNDFAPACLIFFNGSLKIIVEKKVR